MMFKYRILFGVLFGLLSLSLGEEGEPVPAGRPKEKDWSLKVGALAMGNSELLHTKDGGANYVALPYVGLEWKNFYWKGTEVGYNWKAAPMISLSPFAQFRGGLGMAGAPSVLGGSSISGKDMAEGYQGISDRDNQFEAGLLMSVHLSRKNTLELEGRWGERGSSAKALLKRTYAAEDYRWMVSPFVACRVLSPDFVDYYFGVTADEASDPKSYLIDGPYNPEKIGLAGSVGVSGMVRFWEKWALFCALEAQVVSDEIKDSPIVRNRDVYSFVTGISYKF